MAKSDGFSQNETFALGGSGLAVVGAFLPWVEVSVGNLAAATQNGMDGDGTITLILALIAAGVILVRDWKAVDKGVVLVAGLLTAAIGGMYIMDPASGMDLGTTGGQFVSASAKSGLYLTAVGGLGMLAGGALGLQD